MRVKDVMTPNVIGVAEDAGLWDALELIAKSKVSALVVFDSRGAPIGVLSEGDLMRRGELGTQKRRPGWLDFLLGGGRAATEFAHSHGRRVGEIMTRGVIGIPEDAELSQAVDLMTSRHVRRLVVLRGGEAVGVLSRHDVLKALLMALPTETAKRSDAEIKRDVEAALFREPWAPSASIHALVDNGVVTLEGAIADDSLRAGLRVLAENVPGVRRVRDRIAWIEPNSGYLVPIAAEPED